MKIGLTDAQIDYICHSFEKWGMRKDMHEIEWRLKLRSTETVEAIVEHVDTLKSAGKHIPVLDKFRNLMQREHEFEMEVQRRIKRVSNPFLVLL